MMNTFGSRSNSSSSAELIASRIVISFVAVDIARTGSNNDARARCDAEGKHFPTRSGCGRHNLCGATLLYKYIYFFPRFGCNLQIHSSQAHSIQHHSIA